MIKTSDTLPPVSWEEMQDLLMRMATTQAKRDMVQHLMEATRKQMPFLTGAGVMSEVIFIGAAMLDVHFSPTLLEPGVSETS